MTEYTKGSMVDQEIKLSPSSYIGSFHPKPYEAPMDWWRCDECGGAIASESSDGKRIDNCLYCGAKRQ